MKKLVFYLFGITLILTVGGTLFSGYMKKLFSNSGSFMGGFMSGVPVFKTGLFSEDGNYFAYTYQPEIEKPDFDGSITIRGFSYPSYFQIMDCKSGKMLLDKPFDGGKNNQLYVVWEQDDLVWLMQSVYNKGNHLALYDIKRKAFRFEFGELEKANPTVLENISTFYINNTAQKGLLFEGTDNRYYRIDPNTGKVETIQGSPEILNFHFAKKFQVSNNRVKSEYSTRKINGNRESIISNQGKMVSQDDFIEANFLTLTKNREPIGYDGIPLTFYKDYFFVFSPISSENLKDMELAMLNKSNLKTAWKIQLPQKTLKTFSPAYGFERFSINSDQMLVTNNNYLITIDLATGKIVKQENLYP